MQTFNLDRRPKGEELKYIQQLICDLPLSWKQKFYKNKNLGNRHNSLSTEKNNVTPDFLY